MEPKFFEKPEDFRAWLDQHHESEKELLVGYYKKGSGRPSITWPESVDEALCFGWIDGVRRSLGEESYTIRFTPRRPTSTWSAINIKRVQELTREGRMRPAGIRAFEARTESRSETYSYEQARPELSPEQEQVFREHPEAWDFFSKQPPSYRKLAVWWVVSAKQEKTRASRLQKLIDFSRDGKRV